VAAMKRGDALRILAAHRDESAVMDAREPAIFGSVARDEAGAASALTCAERALPGQLVGRAGAGASRGVTISQGACS